VNKSDRAGKKVALAVGNAIVQIERLVQEKKLETALSAARDLKKIVPWIPYPYFLIVDIHRAKGHNGKAIRELERLVETFPDDYEVLQSAAGWYRELGREEEAMKAYQGALKVLSPRAKRKRADLLNEMGTLAWEMERKPEAVDFYRQALAIVPGHRHARRNLDDSLNIYGEPRAASPLLDDLHHFINLQVQAWLTTEGKPGPDSRAEAQKMMEEVMKEWNLRIAPLREKLDGMTAAEKSDLFRSVGFAARQ
jgi:tetratricopeptide (TPR) repeat protein